MPPVNQNIKVSRGLSFETHDSRVIRKRLFLFSWEGALGNIFIILSSGAFLTSLAIYLGANDFEIGLLGALPFLSQSAQLIAPYLIHLTGNRRALTVSGFATARQIWWFLIPLLFISAAWRLELFIIIVTLSAIAGMLATPGWLSWIADIVPEKIRGRYFARRNSAIAATTVTATLLGGIILDKFKLLGRQDWGFAFIISFGCIAAIVSIVLLSRLPDKKPGPNKEHYRLAQILEPLKDKRFRHLLKVFFVWNIAIGIAAIFFAAHMLTNLKMSFTQIAMYSSSVALIAVMTNRLWGALIDRVGSKPVLVFCAFGISAVPLIWLFARADFLWILIFESIYTGALWAGFNLAAFNIPIANSPSAKRTPYLAMFSVITGLGFFLASIIGGLLTENLSGLHWHIGFLVIVNYHVLFVISALLRIMASVFFLSFHEPGEKSFPVVVQFIGYVALKQLSVGRQLFPHRVKRNQEPAETEISLEH
jgi:MFS family permease